MACGRTPISGGDTCPELHRGLFGLCGLFLETHQSPQRIERAFAAWGYLRNRPPTGHQQATRAGIGVPVRDESADGVSMTSVGEMRRRPGGDLASGRCRRPLPALGVLVNLPVAEFARFCTAACAFARVRVNGPRRVLTVDRLRVSAVTPSAAEPPGRAFEERRGSGEAPGPATSHRGPGARTSPQVIGALPGRRSPLPATPRGLPATLLGLSATAPGTSGRAR